MRVQIAATAAISVFVLAIPTAIFYRSWLVMIYATCITFVILMLGTIRRT